MAGESQHFERYVAAESAARKAERRLDQVVNDTGCTDGERASAGERARQLRSVASARRDEFVAEASKYAGARKRPQKGSS